MFQIFKMVNEAMKISQWSGTIYKWVPPQGNIKMPRIQNHVLGFILYDVLFFTLVM
jgi:hypothetical protein